MKVLATKITPKAVDDELLVIPIFEEDLQSSLPQAVADAVLLKDFKAESGEIFSFYDVGFKAKRLIALGLGKKEKLSLESLRKAYASAEKVINKRKVRSFAVIIPNHHIDAVSVVSAMVEGILLSNYRFDKYKSEEKDKSTRFSRITFVGDDSQKIKKILDRTVTLCKCVNFARDLVNENAKDKNPVLFANMVKKMAHDAKVKCTVLTEKDFEKMGAGLILAVNAGNPVPPRMTVLEYHGNPKSKDVYALVGKGIIFDSGGLNIKLTGFIETMRTDMGGAAAVLGVMRAAAELQLKVNLVGVTPFCENLISGTSYKPGDTFKSLSGKTVEIGNTDAEGRLVLADALTYTAKKFKPALMIDLATLTGVARFAVGERFGAMMGNDAKVMTQLTLLGKETGDYVHELPLFEEYKDMLKSPIADIMSIGTAKINPGAITAGLFLQNFVEDTPWVHLDIAGPSFPYANHPYCGNLATGFGVRLLTKFFESVEK